MTEEQATYSEAERDASLSKIDTLAGCQDYYLPIVEGFNVDA
jgi:hypothetical protein